MSDDLEVMRSVVRQSQLIHPGWDALMHAHFLMLDAEEMMCGVWEPQDVHVEQVAFWLAHP